MTSTHKKVTALVGEDATDAEAQDPACLTPGGAADHVQRALGVIDGRWKLTIVFQLFATPVQRFSALQRAIPGVSHKVLVSQLRELERDGVIERTVHPTVPPQVDYRLSDAGRALRTSLQSLREWNTAHGIARE